MIYSVYKLTHIPTGKIYFGRTANVEKRKKTHFYTLKKHPNENVRNLAASGKKTDFCFSVISSDMSDSDSVFLEESLISSGLKSGICLNIQIGSHGGDARTNHPRRGAISTRVADSCRKKISETSSDDLKNIYGRSGDQNGMYGRSHTDEAKKKQSARAKGNSHSKGRVMGDKQRKLISEFAKKRIGNLNPFFGKKHSAETIKKISASRIGKKPLNSRKVLIGGIVYESVTGAARSIGVDPALVIYRIKSTKYKDYEYFSENL